MTYTSPTIEAIKRDTKHKDLEKVLVLNWDEFEQLRITIVEEVSRGGRHPDMMKILISVHDKLEALEEEVE